MTSLLTWRKRLTVPRRNLCVKTCAEVSCAFLQRAIVRAVALRLSVMSRSVCLLFKTSTTYATH